MKLVYVPAVLSLVVLGSLGSQELANAEQAGSAAIAEPESPGVTLQAEPLFGILSGIAVAEPGEEPNIAEAPPVEVNSNQVQGDDPRDWHGFYCPPCGRG